MGDDSFFDTNVIINYASYSETTQKIEYKKCFQYIETSKGKFIICYFVRKEIFNFLTKRAILHKEVLKKIKDRDYEFETSKFLSKRDIPYAKKLYENHKNLPINEVSLIFLEERKGIGIMIDRFLKTKVDELVIPEEEINLELVKIINDSILNYADCKIIASALQHRKKRDDFLLVTFDSRDLDPNGYEYLKDEPKLREYKFPKLVNLMCVD
jgi:predicted nucleic acid-binding protein